MISNDMPHREALEPILSYEFPFLLKRFLIVVRDQKLLFMVVQEWLQRHESELSLEWEKAYRLTASVHTDCDPSMHTFLGEVFREKFGEFNCGR